MTYHKINNRNIRIWKVGKVWFSEWYAKTSDGHTHQSKMAWGEVRKSDILYELKRDPMMTKLLDKDGHAAQDQGYI